MNRRKAIVNLVLGIGAVSTVPTWANRWTTTKYINTQQTEVELLGNIISGIIPEGETPGAQSLKVHYYINDLLENCYPKETRDSFLANSFKVEEWVKAKYGNNFASLTQEQKEEFYALLGNSEIEEEVSYMSLLKRLTIEGYKRSEFYKTNIENYDMAPGFYHGCESI